MSGHSYRILSAQLLFSLGLLRHLLEIIHQQAPALGSPPSEGPPVTLGSRRFRTQTAARHPLGPSTECAMSLEIESLMHLSLRPLGPVLVISFHSPAPMQGAVSAPMCI